MLFLRLELSRDRATRYINECKAGEMPDMKEQLGAHANKCLVSKTKKTGLFTFAVHNFVDDSYRIHPKPVRARLSQGCLHFTQ